MSDNFTWLILKTVNPESSTHRIDGSPFFGFENFASPA